MKTMIHYIHGFNSSIHNPDGSIASEKVQRIAAWCADHGYGFIPETIDYCSAADIQRFLASRAPASSTLKSDNLASGNLANGNLERGAALSPDEHTYIGTSLGGLMALVMAKKCLCEGDKAVLINPAILPMSGQFRQQVGQMLTNFVTGKSSVFSQEALALISSLQNDCLQPTITGVDLPFTQLHLALNDDVVPVRQVAAAVAGLPTFETFTYPGGGHRFDDPQALDNLLRQLPEMINRRYPLPLDE